MGWHLPHLSVRGAPECARKGQRSRRKAELRSSDSLLARRAQKGSAKDGRQVERPIAEFAVIRRENRAMAEKRPIRSGGHQPSIKRGPSGCAVIGRDNPRNRPAQKERSRTQQEAVRRINSNPYVSAAKLIQEGRMATREGARPVYDLES